LLVNYIPLIARTPPFQTIDFLALVGGDLTARDDEGNTPLHVAGRLKSCSPELVQTLMRNGAHLDEANNNHQTFADLVPDPLSKYVDPKPYITLKCLAAKVVSKMTVGADQMPRELAAFVDRH